MKVNKIFIVFFLIVFGYSISSLRKEFIFKTNISDTNSSLQELILTIDFVSGFMYPFLFFTFFYILFNVCSFVVIDKKIDGLSEIITFSMLPNFIFIILNFYYLLDLNSIDVEGIILYKNRSIVPFIDFEFSSIISNYIVYIIPSIFLFFYLIFEKKISLANTFLITFLPIIIVFITYKLLTL
ncbi:MAG: hypothetical protein L3J25_00055 [Flavobacteriaceae bacterium]|nr:hypothetical protein [Flavobacteriaceae bacterium]